MGSDITGVKDKPGPCGSDLVVSWVRPSRSPPQQGCSRAWGQWVPWEHRAGGGAKPSGRSDRFCLQMWPYFRSSSVGVNTSCPLWMIWKYETDLRTYWKCEPPDVGSGLPSFLLTSGQELRWKPAPGWAPPEAHTQGHTGQSVSSRCFPFPKQKHRPAVKALRGRATVQLPLFGSEAGWDESALKRAGTWDTPWHWHSEDPQMQRPGLICLVSACCCRGCPLLLGLL